MKNKHSHHLQTILVFVLAFSLTACNLPQRQSEPTSTTAAATDQPWPTPGPSNTPLPVTETFTPEPPTATPTEVLNTPTSTPTIVFPTKPPTNTPTQAVIKPAARARFDGIYEYGTLLFRIDSNPNYVVPKSVSIKNAPCNENQRKKTDILTLDPPTHYEIVNGRFYIDFAGLVKITGEFITPTKARGSITMYLKADGKRCTLGPYAWTASAE